MSSLNATPGANRVHIGIFGKRNAGKSSIINAITGQNLAIVSDIMGTTTDPVSKAMELLPLGPVLLTDTPGLDDEGELGRLRVEKAYGVLNKTDIALLVVNGNEELSTVGASLVETFRQRGIPYLIVHNKMDLENTPLPPQTGTDIWVSAKTGAGIWELKEKIAAGIAAPKPPYPIIADLLRPADLVVLVVPVDSAAPKGRLILPQQQTIRDILDCHATALVVQDTELEATLARLGTGVRMVVTDSQAFQKVAAITPPEIPLTSFSILFARHKGFLQAAVQGVQAAGRLQNGNKVLICEGCTHHRQCDDIGTIKMPRWLAEYTAKELDYHFTSGGEFPEELTPYSLIVHCGGCTLNERELQSRLGRATRQGVPFTNYGIMIAQVKGILQRSIQPFPGMDLSIQAASRLI
ncbi:MAG: [FeFe] hydrogenase H-cluster maturation GTPase HydF [Oscillospiraceae bacterium]